MRALPLSNRRNTRWWVSLKDISVSPSLHTEGMNELSAAKQAQIIAAICEGASIRSTARQAEVSKNTVAACNQCHEDNAKKDDWVFSQYYPVLRAAASKSK